jgi:2'-5' RNA ligase
MRIFVGLDIDEEIRTRLSRFMDGVREFAPDARWVRPESMHVTLKFIGEKPANVVEHVKTSLQAVRGHKISIAFRGYGFFPTSRSARVFWIGIEAGRELADLAAAVDQAMSSLGIPKEEHPFSPHLTLARAGGRSGSPKRQKDDRPSSGFRKLQEKLMAMPAFDFGSMAARSFYLYESKLGAGGSRYTKIGEFPLGNPE